jgi:hypothetical protein
LKKLQHEPQPAGRTTSRSSRRRAIPKKQAYSRKGANMDFINYLFELLESPAEHDPGLSRKELESLNAKEVKTAPVNSQWLGSTMEAYGDRNYYRTPDGEYIYAYYSIGD